MNVLILGGAGFVGANLVRRWLDDPDARVTVVDSLDPRIGSTVRNLDAVRSSIDFVQGDVRDARLMREVVQGKDVIYNCAAQTSHPLSMADPLFDAEVNCLGSLTVLEAVREEDVERRVVLIYPSTSTIVGAAAGEVVDVPGPENPVDIYSANKGVAEKYYRIYHRAHGLKTVVLRFPNLYGPFGKDSPAFGFANYFIHLAWKGRDITVYGSGEQRRNLVFIDDAVELLYRSAFNERLIGTAYFAVNPEHVCVGEIARAIVSVFGRGKVVSVEWPNDRRRIEVGDVLLSSPTLWELTGWRPRFSLETGLRKTREVMTRLAEV